MAEMGIDALAGSQAPMGGGQMPGQPDEVTQVITHYFRNRDIPLDKGMAAVQKEVSEGLKLIPYGKSVMGLKMLSADTAKVHFFTMGTEQELDADIAFFAAQLQRADIHTIYDTELDPMAARGLQMVGYKIVKSDKPEFKLKATK
jgi:hypothetical protein